MSSELLLCPAPTSLRVDRAAAAWHPSPAARDWARGLDAVDWDKAPKDIKLAITGSACGSQATHAQSYRLHIDAAGAHIEAPTPVGLRYARATLAQLLAMHAEAVLALHIDDEPAIATRGVMLDCSRCRIPTMREFFSIIDELARRKCNHLQLYIEHTFAYRGHEAAWAGWSAITPDELSQIDSYCHARGIELAANQNCFGHMQHWLKLPKYAHLAETHGEWMFAGAWPRSGPWSLCPTDSASLAFVQDLLSQQTACVRGPLCNINCDETYDIAFGRSAASVQQHGRERVYLEFVQHVCDVVASLGKRPMLWADIALSHPACLKDWPRDAIALAWDYEADDKFAQWGPALAQQQIEHWVCPGTSSWCSFVGRTQERRHNLAQAVRAAKQHGATGLLMTDWGDFGHWQTWPIARHALRQGLAAAWQGTGETPVPPEAASFDSWLDTLGDVDLALREVALPLSRPNTAGRLRNQTALFADLRVPWDDLRGMPMIEPWEAALARLQACSRAMPACDALAQDVLAQDELTHTLACAEFALLRASARRRTPHACDARTHDDLLSRVQHLTREHARLWLIRSRAGGLQQSIETLMLPVERELQALRQQPLFVSV